MPSIPHSQALGVSHPEVLASYLKSNPCDQLLPRVPKIPVRGDGLQVTDIAELATADFISSGGTVDDTATTWDPPRVYRTMHIPGRVDVNTDIAQDLSEINDITELQVQSKMVAMWNQVGNNLIYGGGGSPDPLGLQTMATLNPTGVLQPDAGASTPMTLLDYDRMIEAVCPWDGGQPRYFVMNPKQYRHLIGLARSAGLMLPLVPDPILGRPLSCYNGVCILVDAWITNTEGVGNDFTSVYLVHLGTRDGDPQLGGLVWFYTESLGPGVRVDGPHRNSGTDDRLFMSLDLNIGFAPLSLNAVLGMSQIQA